MFLARREVGGFLRVYFVNARDSAPVGSVFAPSKGGGAPPEFRRSFLCGPGAMGYAPTKMHAVRMLRAAEESVNELV
jgi:hypothetical protein